MSSISSPLTAEHLMQINDGLAKLDIAEAGIEKAKQAGVDVSQSEQTMKDSRTKLLALKRTYFPNG